MYYGKVTLRKELVESLNIPAVTTYNALGKQGNEFYNKLGINISENDGLSASLGALTDGVSPLTIAKAYSVFANSGVMQEYNCIDYIENANGKIIYKSESLEKEVFSKETSFIIYDILKDVSKYGTAKKLKNFNVASKTGTNGNEKGNLDAWCVSFDKNFTILTYLGTKNDFLDNSITGGATHASINEKLLSNILKNGVGEDILKPESVKKVNIDKYNLEKNGIVSKATTNTPYKYILTEYFDKNKEPKRMSDIFTNPKVDNAKIELIGNKIKLTIPTQEVYDYIIYNN